MTQGEEVVLTERRREFMADTLGGDWAKLLNYAEQKDPSWWADVYQLACKAFTFRERGFETVYYAGAEELSYSEIAKKAGVSRARIDQLHRQIYYKLRFQIRNIVQLRMKRDEAGLAGITGNGVTIAEVGFSPRTFNCLVRGSYSTLASLAAANMTELEEIRGFGKKCLLEVEDVLAGHGLCLAE